MIKQTFSRLSQGLFIYFLFYQLVYAHGMSDAEIQAIIAGGNLSYIKIGASHMLTGLDHLLFIFGVIFFLRTFIDVVKYVTAFTVGHSVTLIYATFNAIQLNYFLIDAVIGLSVCYIAFANLDGFRKYLKITPPSLMVMVFGFGLVHGFGLSSRLQELPLSEDNLLLNIISFNLGIELGQIFALTIMLLLMLLWRKSKSFPAYSALSNYLLILTGGFLFLMQMHGYAHYMVPDEIVNVSEVVQTSIVSGESTTPDNNVLQDSPRQDMITISVPARGSIEYKFYLEQGASFEYIWESSGEAVFYDFHGEPEGDSSGYFESFEKNMSSQASGTLTAPFTGIHGWYWKNGTASQVDIMLMAKGQYQRLDIEE